MGLQARRDAHKESPETDRRSGHLLSGTSRGRSIGVQKAPKKAILRRDETKIGRGYETAGENHKITKRPSIQAGRSGKCRRGVNLKNHLNIE